MDFLNKVTAFLPLRKKEEKREYFFATNISAGQITAALWTIEGKNLKVLSSASAEHSSNDEIPSVLDKLLDQVLGVKEIEPSKILFGVPASWLTDDNLKDEYLKLLRQLVKELELTPMAYVSTSNALIHFLERQEGVPTTAILVGFEKEHLTVTVARAGKIDGVKVVKRGETAGSDIEKALLAFTDVETLPSKILLYGESTPKLKAELLSFSWMSKLSFLHFPKIEVLGEDLEIKSVCLAGGSELDSDVAYTDSPLAKGTEKVTIDEEATEDLKESTADEAEDVKEAFEDEDAEVSKEAIKDDNLGFMVGDISKKDQEEMPDEPINEDLGISGELGKEELVVSRDEPLEIEDFEQESAAPVSAQTANQDSALKKFVPRSFGKFLIPLAVVIGLSLLAGAYVFLPTAQVKIFVEPKVLEKDAQVIADPNQKTIDEAAKIIPGQIVDVDISGSAKDQASGKRQIGDPAKGTMVIINNTAQGQNFSAGTVLATSGGIKFKLDNTASVSATLLDADSKSKVTVSVTAVEIGADGNIPSETNLSVGNFSNSQFVGKAQGNFSGGTSKDVTVVSNEDQQRLLAKLTSDLRQQAQQKLQEKYPNKKILQEALSEGTVKKSYSKNINDQANEFSLNMTIKYKGTAFDDADLKTIVSKLVTTQVPEGFSLNITETETQADVSKLEKDGKLIFLAKFRAKLMPQLDTNKIKEEIKFKPAEEVTNILKGMENILGTEINLTPKLPKVLQRLPILSKNIKIEVGLK